MNLKNISNRVRTKEMEKAIYRPKQNTRQKTKHIPDETIVFCLIGSENELVNLNSVVITNTEKSYPRLWDLKDKKGIKSAELRDEACAKIDIKNGKITYWIKRNTNGRFLNPIGIYDEGRHMKEMKHAGRAEFRYDVVNQKVFELYLNFLHTKNFAWLTNSQREVI